MLLYSAGVASDAPSHRRRIREITIGVASAAAILALMIAPWWVVEAGLIGLGAFTVWWTSQVPLERVMSRRARIRLLPLVVLAAAALVAYSAFEFVERVSLLLTAGLFAVAVAFLVSRWLTFVREA